MPNDLGMEEVAASRGWDALGVHQAQRPGRVPDRAMADDSPLTAAVAMDLDLGQIRLGSALAGRGAR